MTVCASRSLQSRSPACPDRQMTHWKQHQSQGVQSTKRLRGFCDSATHSSSTICNDSVGPWKNVVARNVEPAREKKKTSGSTSNLLTSEGRPPINPVDIFWSHVRFRPTDSQLRGALLMEGALFWQQGRMASPSLWDAPGPTRDQW